MKKMNYWMAGVVVLASMASCSQTTPKANLKSDIDTLSYAIGMAQTEGLKDYLERGEGIDAAYMDEFYKGVVDASHETSAKQQAYMVGLQIGRQISNRMMKGINRDLFGEDSTQTINLDNFLAGFVAGAEGNDTTIMTVQAANAYMRQGMEAMRHKSLLKTYGENKEAGEKFLAENKTKEGVVVTESGLQYKVLVAGKGETPAATDKVKVNYKGTLIDGTEFDSSSKHGDKPSEFYANQVIKGWTEALTLMPVGSKWELYIPQELAYGERNMGNIKPFSTLVFEVELVEIVKPAKK